MHFNFVLTGAIALFIILLLVFRRKLFSVILAWYFGAPPKQCDVITESEIPVTMRDGVRLFTDVYRPKEAGKFPTVMMRTPYGKKNQDHQYINFGKLFAGQGFAFVVQDVRGKRPSEGEFYPHKNDIEDGADTIDWIVKQPWSDGQICLFGFSYLGITAWQAASGTNHKIATVMPWFSSSDPYKLWYENNVLYLKQVIFWNCTYDGPKKRKIDDKAIDKAISTTTEWKKLDEALAGETITPFRDFLNHPDSDDKFWHDFFVEVQDIKQDFPVLLGSGWYDQFLLSTIADFKALQNSSGKLKRQSRLVIGPWTHNPTDKIINLNLGHDASFITSFHIFIDWCRKWMKGDKTVELPPVTYYLMIKNQWHTAEDWPPPEAEPLVFFLSAQGELTTRPPAFGKRVLSFEPKDYMPAIGGHMIYIEDQEGPKEQSFLFFRNDVLIWTSEILMQEMTIVGPPQLKLNIQTSLPSFDLMVKFIDMFPDGQMRLITDGYHRYNSKTTKPTQALFAVMDTAYVLLPGHSLQIAITHSDFPAYEPNQRLLHLDEASVTVISGDPENPTSLEVLLLPKE